MKKANNKIRVFSWGEDWIGSVIEIKESGLVIAVNDKTGLKSVFFSENIELI